MDAPKLPQRGKAPTISTDKIDLKAEFQRISEGRDYLGASDGAPAYAYVRVSSETQTEEGCSGLPRQLLHIHQIAQTGRPEQGIPPLKVTWDMVYADEGFSGFEFRNRPALNALLDDIRSNGRSAFALAEHLDRLSRNATWHQGYLLEQIETAGCKAVFWKAFGSEIERSVMGAISEQGMKHEIQRMTDGQILKAKRGRVTAKRPRFGYMFVDSHGRPLQSPGTDSHYALHPEQSKVMRWVYEALIYQRRTLNEVTRAMNEGAVPMWQGPVPTGFGGVAWHVGTLAALVKNPIYKGEFYARRHRGVKTGAYNAAGREKTRMEERDREEWIRIDVPAIVTAEEWALAQKRLEENLKRCNRNMRRRNWLLSSLIRCARCGYTYTGVVGGTKRTRLRYYACVSRSSAKAKSQVIACVERKHIRAEILEGAVWDAVAELIMEPQVLLDTLDADQGEKLGEYRQQREYLEASLGKLDTELQRWNRAYASEVIDLAELKGYRADILRRQEALRVELDELAGRIARIEGVEDKNAFVREILGVYRKVIEDAGQDLPYELKREVLKMLVDTIWVDDRAMTARIEGVVSSTVDLTAISFASCSSPR